MTDYPYEPPERAFSDTLLAFRDFELSSTWAVRVEPDPLGPVNQVVTLMRGRRRVKSVLARVPAGAKVGVGYDQGTPRIRFWGPSWQELTGHPGYEVEPYRAAAWYVEIDGRRVIEVSEHETYPPSSPAPHVPLWTRLRRITRQRARSAADGVAGRLGYHRDDDCGGD